MTTGRDVLLAALVFVILAVGVLAASAEAGEPDLRWFAVAFIAGEAVPLVWRRRFPVTVACAVGLATSLYGVAELPDPLLHAGLLVALYTVAAQASRRVTLIVAAVGVVVALGSVIGAGDSGAEDYYNALLTGMVAMVLGDRQRVRASFLARERAAEASRAAADERARIARELHDVVAHHVSMVVVQAEAGAAVGATEPGRVVQDFDAIAGTSRRALTELRRLLGVLRGDAGNRMAEVTPQPSLDHLSDLIDDVSRAGLPVSFRVDGTPRRLADGVDLCAYRIVQEALTNVVRHAGPVPTTVVVRYLPSALELEVADEGDGVRNGGSSSGHGLVGIRERVAMLGGDVQIGPRSSGGFSVAARLPVGAAP